MRENQHPISSGTGLTTLYKKGKNPPDFTLDYIVKDLLLYFKGICLFKKYEKEIEKKYKIKKEPDDCWPEDDIKRAWGKTQRMYKTSKRRKCWSLAVMLQIIKRSSHDCGETQNKRRDLPPGSKNLNEMKQNINNETIYIRIPFSEMFGNKSSFSSEEHESQEKESSSVEHQPESLSYKLKDRVPSFSVIEKKKSYVMLYDNRTRNAAWVYEILNKSTLAKTNANKSSFKVDDSIHEFFQTPEGKRPYEKPFDRGHLAPARNHRSSQRALNDTYLLSNISPQCQSLNRRIWKKLEERCWKKAKEDGVRNVHVYTGPLFLSNDKDSNHVKYEIEGGKAVPTHFFKVIIVEDNYGTVSKPQCYKIPNEESEKEINLAKKQVKCVKKTSKNQPICGREVAKKQPRGVTKASKKQPKGVKKVSQKNLKNYDSDDSDELEYIEVQITDIEKESGLIFTESRCTEEMIDSTLTLTLKADVNVRLNRSELKVRISTPLSD